MQGKKRLAIIIASIIATLVLVAGLIWVINHPYNSTGLTTNDTSSTNTNAQKNNASPNTNSNTSKPAETTPTAPQTPAPDPSTVKSLDISQLGLTLNYDRTLPGLSYEISRTGDGTQYVSLTYDGLVGSKCTGDQGEFASIIKNPTNTDSIAINNTVKLGNDTYGLALPDNSCTGNVDLFNQYQASMKANFPYMKLADSNP